MFPVTGVRLTPAVHNLGEIPNYFYYNLNMDVVLQKSTVRLAVILYIITVSATSFLTKSVNNEYKINFYITTVSATPLLTKSVNSEYN